MITHSELTDAIDALHDSMVGPIHIDQGEPIDFCVDKETPMEPQPTSLPMLAVHAFSLLPQDSTCNENTVIGRAQYVGWLSDIAGVSYVAARGILAEAVVEGLLELAGPGEDVGDVTWTHLGYDTAATKGWLIHHSPKMMQKLCFEDDPEADAAEAAIARAAEQLVLEAEIAEEKLALEAKASPVAETAAQDGIDQLADLAVERITSLEKLIKEQEACIQQQGTRIARLEGLLMTFGSAVDSQL